VWQVATRGSYSESAASSTLPARERSTSRQVTVASATRFSPTKALPSMRTAFPRQALTSISIRS